MDGAPRLDRRALLTLSAAAAAIAVSGCGTRPGDSTSDAPQLSRAEVQRIQDDYAHTTFQAMRTRDRDLIRTVESGPLLHRDLAAMKLADQLRQPRQADEYTLPRATGYPLYAADADDRQRLLTVSDYSNAPRRWRNLGLSVRAAAGSPWWHVFSGGLYGADVPDFPTDQPLSVISPDATGFAVPPADVPQLVADALQDAGSAAGRRFAASDVFQRYADDLVANNQKAAAMGPVTRRYRPGDLIIAIATDGGYLALGAISFTQTVTAKTGSSVYFSKESPQHRVFPGQYDESTSTYQGLWAVTVPQAGKLTVLSGEERQTGLTAS